MIELIDVSVEFDGRTVVDRVNLKINKGDIFGIVGFSGAGKSTLVRTINLLQRPTRGSVLVHDESGPKESAKNLTALSSGELRAERKKIGMIFQHFNLLSKRTVLDNVLYPIRHERTDKEEKRKKARRLLDLVGIADKENAYPRQLSGGQQQRCAIARALAGEPKILLCDEATSALDPKTTKQILALLKRVHEELGLTIVIISHQMEVVKEICNRCAIMQDGRIVEEASTLEIFSRPESEAGRDFVETASNRITTIQKIRQELIEPAPDEVLCQLSYVGSSTTEPIINELYRRWNITTNILAGGIERIGSVPVGNLIVTLRGDREKINEAGRYLAEKNTELILIGKEN